MCPGWIPNALIREDLALMDPDEVARVELRGDHFGRRWRDDGTQVVEDSALVRALATAFKACVMDASYPYDPSMRTLETIAFVDRRPPHTAYQVWFRMEALRLFFGPEVERLVASLDPGPGRGRGHRPPPRPPKEG